MLKNNTFLASIFEGLGPRFGRVFGRFFCPKMHAKSDLKKIVQEPFRTVKTNIKSMLAILQQSIFRAKIDEKSHVFWNLDFDRILGGFWEGFGRPKSSIFAHFSMFCRCHFSMVSTPSPTHSCGASRLGHGSQNPRKIGPRPSKIEPRGLQNRARRPPRRHF